MIRIGEFARLANVSVAMLRHYDELGLVKPYLVDEATGYRYYSVRQLPLLHQIVGLRDLDFSLAQIADWFMADANPDRLQTMLELKYNELQTRIASEQARLLRVQSRLRLIERGEPMNAVKLKSVKSQLVASVRNPALETSTPEGWRSIQGYYDLLHAHLKQHLKPDSPSYGLPQTNLWHEAGSDNQTPEPEVTQNLEKPIPESEAVRVYELPALPEAASLIFEGRYDGEPMTRAFTALYGWIEDNRYQIVGPTRQVFLSALKTPEEFLIELQVPVQLI